MIEISLSTALAFYSSVLGIGAFLLWLYTELTVQRTHRVLERQHLWKCVICAYTYLDESAESLSECPRCHSINALHDKHARLIRDPRAKRKASEEALNKGPAADQEGRRNPSRRKRPGARRRGPRRHR